MFHPGLANSFEYVVGTQIDEFRRLYGADPIASMAITTCTSAPMCFFASLLPAGTSVRRNFSFHSGEKSVGNRLYRQFVDGLLSGVIASPTFSFRSRRSNRHGRLDRVFTLGAFVCDRAGNASC